MTLGRIQGTQIIPGHNRSSPNRSCAAWRRYGTVCLINHAQWKDIHSLDMSQFHSLIVGDLYGEGYNGSSIGVIRNCGLYNRYAGELGNDICRCIGCDVFAVLGLARNINIIC